MGGGKGSRLARAKKRRTLASPLPELCIKMPHRFVYLGSNGRVHAQKWPDDGLPGSGGAILAEHIISDEEMSWPIDRLVAKFESRIPPSLPAHGEEWGDPEI